MADKLRADQNRALDGNQEATEGMSPRRQVTIAKGKGEKPDAATASPVAGDPAEGADATERAS